MKEAQNLITDNNDIQEGLNFIVPSLWWKNLLSDNSYLRNIKEIRIRQSNPLDNLYQLGIMYICHNNSQKDTSDIVSSFNSIVRDAQSSYRKIKKQLKQAETVSNGETQGKRNRLPFQWLEETINFQTSNCDILLHSPEVNQEIVELFEMTDQYWVYVSPQLYRLIWLNSKETTKKNSRKLTAIPIIMKRSQIQNFNKRISFYNKKNVDIFINNVSGYSFAFKGFIDSDLPLEELIRYLDDGMFRLVGGCQLQKSSQESNKVIQIPNTNNIFYDLESEQSTEVLPWTQFKQIKYCSLKKLNISRINVFLASYSTNTNNEYQNKIEPISSRTRKKRKGDFTVYQSQNGDSKIAGIREIGEGVGIQTRLEYAAREPNDVHYSTQEQTPADQRSQRNVILIQNSTNPTQNRITHPIWREGHQAQKLIKYAQVRIAIPKIYLPYNNDQRVLLLKEEGKKVVLPRVCNELMINEQGELKQKQISQPQIGLKEQPPNQSIRKQLQILALQIQGIKVNEMVQEGQKMRQFAKQKEENQMRTSKNDILDEMDCEQSRQF